MCLLLIGFFQFTDKYKGEYCQDEITIEDRLNTPVKITIGYTASRIRNLYNFELNMEYMCLYR